MMKPHIGIDERRAFGNAGSCRRAMLQIHGFEEKDLRKIEDGIECLQTETGRHRLKRKGRWQDVGNQTNLWWCCDFQL